MTIRISNPISKTEIDRRARGIVDEAVAAEHIQIQATANEAEPPLRTRKLTVGTGSVRHCDAEPENVRKLEILLLTM